MEPKSPSKTKPPIMGFVHNFRVLKVSIILVVVILLISVGVYLLCTQGFVSSSSSHFTVVIDCGSSGTRVNVYEWVAKDGVNNGELPILLHSYPNNFTKGSKEGVCAYHCMQTEPGLDKFVGNVSGVRASLEPLINWAEKWVPREQYRDTPIFVLATAGLRRLPVEDARRVLIDVGIVVKEHKFMYRRNWIRVLSGREEAYYGWVALNYHMGIFGNSSRLHTLGLLDLGGSSLQVVTEVNESSEHEDVLKSKIGLVEHEISAYSFPSFGLNEAFDTSVVMLSHSQALRETASGTFKVGHPCLSSGVVRNYTCRGCFGVVYSDAKNLSSQMRENEVNSIILAGEPNWEKCKGLARAAAINSSNSDWSRLSDDSNCTGLSSFSDENILNLAGNNHSIARYHALSGFFAIYKLLNLNPRANLTKIWEKSQQFCSRSWAGLTSTLINKKYAEQYCFSVPYLVSLIENKLCLGDREIIFGPGDVSWTLGAALIEGEDSRVSTNSGAGSGISAFRVDSMVYFPFFLFVLLVCLLFIVYRCQIKLPMPGRKVASVGASLPSYMGPKRRPP